MPSLSVAAGVAGPTARVAHLGSAAATVVLAGLPAVATVARGGTDLRVPVVLLALGTGASVAWAAEDPAAELLSAMPVSAPARAIIRVVAAAAVAAWVCAALLGVIAAGPGLPPGLADRLPEGAAAAAAGLAVAFVAARRGERMAGPGAVVAGIVLPAFVAGLAIRWPAQVPNFMSGDVHDRWWLVVGVGAVIVTRNGRDPASR